MIECTDCGSKFVAHECPATLPTPTPLRAALQGLRDGYGSTYSFGAGQFPATSVLADLDALLTAHPEPELRPYEVEHDTNGRPRSERDGACVCDYNPTTTDGPQEDCPFHGQPYAYWIERGDELQARLAPPVAHQDTEREVRFDCCGNVSVNGHSEDCFRYAPPVPETDEAAATLAEVEKLFRGTFFGDFGGHDWRGGDATVQEFARDLGRLLHDYRKQADR